MALEQEVKVYQFPLGYGEMPLADIADLTLSQLANATTLHLYPTDLI